MSKKANIITFGVTFLLFIITFSYAFYMRGKYAKIYDNGISLLEDGKYEEAVDCFSGIPNYIDYQDISELLNTYEVSVCSHCGALLK